MAKQAAGSAVIQFGETMVLAAVTVADSETSLPFFPLTVEYREKSYAAGKIPGGFFKREGRPGEEEILAGRLIDRSIRPLFPKGFNNEVQVFVYVLSADQENDADVLGLTAASLALAVSRVPWDGPIAGVRVGRIEGDWVVNPTFQQLEFSDLDMVVSGRADSVMMVEGGALELGENEITDALRTAQQGIGELVAMQQEIIKAVGSPKMEWSEPAPPPDLVRRVEQAAAERVAEALNLSDKSERSQALGTVRSDVVEQLADEFADHVDDTKRLLESIEANTMRGQVLERG
ncbi:MAG: polyribonucleotide nucleotidyltransferase, partial [Gemmatimonadales bacterium]